MSKLPTGTILEALLTAKTEETALLHAAAPVKGVLPDAEVIQRAEATLAGMEAGVDDYTHAYVAEHGVAPGHSGTAGIKGFVPLPDAKTLKDGETVEKRRAAVGLSEGLAAPGPTRGQLAAEALAKLGLTQKTEGRGV